MFKNEYQSSFTTYRDIDDEDREKISCKKLGEHPIHRKIKRFVLDGLLWACDATLLYPSALWVEETICIFGLKLVMLTQTI